MKVEFSSASGTFHVELQKAPLMALLQAARAALPDETGGILIGYYTGSLRRAVIERATPPPSDSRTGPTSFYRGVKGLRGLLSKLWRRPLSKRRYYLGEWHFHPGGAAIPSAQDRDQIQEIADSTDYQCPEPILLLLGGDPQKKYSLGAWIFLRGERPVRLIRDP